SAASCPTPAPANPAHPPPAPAQPPAGSHPVDPAARPAAREAPRPADPAAARPADPETLPAGPVAHLAPSRTAREVPHLADLAQPPAAQAQHRAREAPLPEERQVDPGQALRPHRAELQAWEAQRSPAS